MGWPNSFACLLLVCQNWAMWTYNLLYAMLYGYDDWSLIYLLRIGLFALWGILWHNFSVLSRLVWLERIRDRRKDMLILQG